MNKDQLLQELSNKIGTGEISYDEMMNRFNLKAIKTEVPIQESVKPKSNFSITKMLYVLGAIIAVIGIILFTYQIWQDIGSFGRILVTLGLGLIITGAGSFLSKDKLKENLSSVFYFIGGMLIPGGVLVAVSEFNSGQYPLWQVAISFGMVFVFYLLLNFVKKNPILTFFTIANGTVFIYRTVNAITNGYSYDYSNLYVYLTMIIGACYILLGYSFREDWNKRLSVPLYFFGFIGIQLAALYQYLSLLNTRDNSIWPATISFGLIFAFYLLLNFNFKNPKLTLLTIINGTAFIYILVQNIITTSNVVYNDINLYLTMIIGTCYLLLAHSFRNGWNSKLTEILNFFGALGILSSTFSKIYDSLPWQLFFFILVIGGFALSVYVKSRGILVLSTLFLIAYVSYITSKYFADSIGWPISLVILGFIFIALGYVSIKINKKYIQENN